MLGPANVRGAVSPGCSKIWAISGETNIPNRSCTQGRRIQGLHKERVTVHDYCVIKVGSMLFQVRSRTVELGDHVGARPEIPGKHVAGYLALPLLVPLLSVALNTVGATSPVIMQLCVGLECFKNSPGSKTIPSNIQNLRVHAGGESNHTVLTSSRTIRPLKTREKWSTMCTKVDSASTKGQYQKPTSFWCQGALDATSRRPHVTFLLLQLLLPQVLLLQVLQKFVLSPKPLGFSLQAGQKLRMLRGRAMRLLESRERLTARRQPKQKCAWKLNPVPLRQAMEHADLLWLEPK
mmetsp:Transcript_66335/g.130703  ORF Transcript_66335/g.130703 Transcript_66335/m.130703 type:complete len:293 (+) Transcript_66335:449-1327(+)